MLDLEAIRERVGRATIGPWKVYKTDYVLTELGRSQNFKEDRTSKVNAIGTERDDPQLKGPYPIVTTAHGPYYEPQHAVSIRDDDAEFIAHAREDIPALLDLVDDLRAQLQQATSAPAPSLADAELISRKETMKEGRTIDKLHRETGTPIWALEIAFELSARGMLDEETQAGLRVIPDVAKFIADQITALRALQPSEAWRDIESAPKDGTRILLWCVHRNAAYAKDPIQEGWEGAVIGHWTEHNGGGWVWSGMMGQLVGWQPLPAPLGAEERLQRRCFDECMTAHWDDGRQNSFGEEIAHLHEELSEAFRAWRKYKDCEVREIDGKLEGVPIEFADVLIGLFYNAELHGFDLLEALQRKHQFNLNRNYVTEGRQLHPASTVPPPPKEKQ